MNIRRILISEQEKKEILGMYEINNNIVSEQTINQDGTYTTKNTYKFIPTADPSPNPKFNPTFKAGTKIWTNFDKPDEDKIYFGTTDYYLTCSFQGYDNVIQYKEGDTLKENNTTPILTAAVRKLFCNDKKGKKTWNQVTGKSTTTGGGGKESSTKIKLPDLTEKNFCNLSGDKVWEYAKLDDGTWYTRKKGQEEWIKLQLPKYQKAIDLLEKDAKCGSLEEIPQSEVIPIGVLPLKPLTPITINRPTEIIKP